MEHVATRESAHELMMLEGGLADGALVIGCRTKRSLGSGSLSESPKDWTVVLRLPVRSAASVEMAAQADPVLLVVLVQRLGRLGCRKGRSTATQSTWLLESPWGARQLESLDVRQQLMLLRMLLLHRPLLGCWRTV